MMALETFSSQVNFIAVLLYLGPKFGYNTPLSSYYLEILISPKQVFNLSQEVTSASQEVFTSFQEVLSSA